MSTTRCTPEERKALRKHWDSAYVKGRGTTNDFEPALGTVEERLSIILKNLGVKSKVVLTKEEKRQLALCKIS